VLFGILTWFYLPSNPASVSWLSPEEKQLAVTRLTNMGQESHHSQISKEQIKEVVCDLRIWLAALIYLTLCTCVYSVSFFLPAIIQQFGFSVLISNLLTVPVYGVTFFRDRSQWNSLGPYFREISPPCHTIFFLA